MQRFKGLGMGLEHSPSEIFDLILMLFYVFLHHFLSTFVNFFFLMFSSLFHQFWVFTALLEVGGDMPKGGGRPLATSLY